MAKRKEKGKRHPTLGNNVMVSAGAKVLGSFKIGDNSKIGGGSVVLEEVPSNSTVVGVPGRVVKRNKKTVPQADLNQNNLPDPILSELNSIELYNHKLEKRVEELERQLMLLEQDLAPVYITDPTVNQTPLDYGGYI